MDVNKDHLITGLLAAADRYRDMANTQGLGQHLREPLLAMERDMVRIAALAEVCDTFNLIRE
jgi:hypothetical protein